MVVWKTDWFVNLKIKTDTTDHEIYVAFVEHLLKTLLVKERILNNSTKLRITEFKILD